MGPSLPDHAVRDRDQRVPCVIEYLDVVERMEVHGFRSAFHAEFDVLVHLDHVGIESLYPQLSRAIAR